MVEGKKFTRKSGVQSAFLFLFNYVLLLLVITFFIFLNSLEKQADSFIGFFSNQPNNIIYLASSIFMLYLAIYLYYLFEDKNFLATPKNIFLLFSVLGVCIVVCYFFQLFFQYLRPSDRAFSASGAPPFGYARRDIPEYHLRADDVFHR